MLIARVLPLTCYRKKLQIYPTTVVASKFDRFESSWLQHVGTTARKGVQNTHHWSGRNETLPKDEVAQTGSHHHCGQPFVSGVVDRRRSVMRVLYTFSCNISYMYYYVTCSRREMPNVAHILSVEWPIVSLDVNSATAGICVNKKYT